MSWEQKYLKYKEKYLGLKGGNPTDSSTIDKTTKPVETTNHDKVRSEEQPTFPNAKIGKIEDFEELLETRLGKMKIEMDELKKTNEDLKAKVSDIISKLTKSASDNESLLRIKEQISTDANRR